LPEKVVCAQVVRGERAVSGIAAVAAVAEIEGRVACARRNAADADRPRERQPPNKRLAVIDVVDGDRSVSDDVLEVLRAVDGAGGERVAGGA
jgi:hypothetical protein